MITKTDVKTFLNILTTDSDAFFDAYIAKGYKKAEKILQLSITQGVSQDEYVEYFPLTNDYELRPSIYVKAVVSLVDEDAKAYLYTNNAFQLTILSTEYLDDTNLTLTYTSNIETDLGDIVMRYVAFWYLRSNSIAGGTFLKNRRTNDGLSESYMTEPEFDNLFETEIRDLLNVRI